MYAPRWLVIAALLDVGRVEGQGPPLPSDSNRAASAWRLVRVDVSEWPVVRAEVASGQGRSPGAHGLVSTDLRVTLDTEVLRVTTVQRIRSGPPRRITIAAAGSRDDGVIGMTQVATEQARVRWEAGDTLRVVLGADSLFVWRAVLPEPLKLLRVAAIDSTNGPTRAVAALLAKDETALVLLGSDSLCPKSCVARLANASAARSLALVYVGRNGRLGVSNGASAPTFADIRDGLLSLASRDPAGGEVTYQITGETRTPADGAPRLLEIAAPPLKAIAPEELKVGASLLSTPAGAGGAALPRGEQMLAGVAVGGGLIVAASVTMSALALVRRRRRRQYPQEVT